MKKFVLLLILVGLASIPAKTMFAENAKFSVSLGYGSSASSEVLKLQQF